MRLIRAKNYDDMSLKAANIIAAQVSLNPKSVLGLATGSTPIGTYRHLVEWYQKGELDFGKAVSINLDEYCGLSGEHPQSYRRFMRENLFDHINIPADRSFLPDGTRYTDSQCGLFGVSRQMQRYGVPFSYIENCRVSDPIFADGLDKFVRVACMIKNFRGMRIAQVGLRPKPFCSVIFNEGELMQRFGMHIIPVNMAVIIDKYNRILKERDAELEEGAKILFERYQMDKDTPPLAKKIYAFVLLYKEIFEEYDVDVISSECWTSMQLGVGAMPCTAYSILADMGYIVSCESDMHGAISMALLSCAALGKNPPFFGEFTVRHPEDKNVELLWHCGPFAYSLKKPGTIAREENQRQWFQVKDGKFTICRFDQDDGHYQLLNGTLESADGPYTFGTYLWARFNNLTKWERKLIDGPYIHHMAEVEGDYTWELREFCRLIPHLDSDTVD